MEHVIQRFTWHYVPFTDYAIPFGGVNIGTVLNTMLVVALLLGIFGAAARGFSLVPGRRQVALELLVEVWDNLAGATFNAAADPEYADKRLRFVPFLAALFAFILASNMIVALPAPFIMEPTSDLNCTLALGLFSICYATFYGFYYGGFRGAFAQMAGPLWNTKGAKGIAAAAGKTSSLLFFPIHVVGEISKVLSLSFRLFGNIVGGATIMAVIFMLTYGLVFPLGLAGFFIGFVAIVQAFVFTMLTLVYIAVATR